MSYLPLLCCPPSSCLSSLLSLLSLLLSSSSSSSPSSSASSPTSSSPASSPTCSSSACSPCSPSSSSSASVFFFCLALADALLCGCRLMTVANYAMRLEREVWGALDGPWGSDTWMGWRRDWAQKATPSCHSSVNTAACLLPSCYCWQDHKPSLGTLYWAQN